MKHVLLKIMTNSSISENKNSFNIENPREEASILKISYALSSQDRINIIKSLLVDSKNLTTLSKELNIPMTSLSRHIDILADAKLIFLNYQPGPKGHTKYCALATLGYSVSFSSLHTKTDAPIIYSVELPIGMFSHCHIEAPCGMLSSENKIADFDEPSNFFNPERYNAECLWFDKGFISYNFPTPPKEKREGLSEINFSFEICSETNCYNNNWPSDITIKINKTEILTFTSPGDFGGRRGKYTPQFWPISSTQFGMLKYVTINNHGAFLDNQLINENIKFDDLRLFEGSSIQLSIGIKDTAKYKGGINLFGKNFGDYPQGIKMTLTTNSINNNE